MSTPFKFVKSLENRTAKVAYNLCGVTLSGQYSDGDYTKQATALVTAEVQRPAALVNSCGSALYLAYRWLYKMGHRAALVQNNTFYATGAMALEAGISVTLVDSGRNCPSMSIEALKKAHRDNPVASVVVLTHVGGWLAKDYLAIAAYCDDCDLFLLEDCAHVFGVPNAGLLGDAACWSFYATKAVPCGEGGALSSPIPALVAYARDHSNYGKHFTNGKMFYERSGFNFRMSEWDAAVLCAQLEDLPAILAARARDAALLAQSIAPCLLSGPTNWYKYPVKPEQARGYRTLGKVYADYDQLKYSLASYDPPTDNHQGKFFGQSRMPNAARWTDNHVCLPLGEGLYDGMTPEQLKQYIKA